MCIQQRLLEHVSFRQVAKELGKDPGTIAKEIRRNSFREHTGAWGTCHNACHLRVDCSVRNLCQDKHCRKACCFCGKCNLFCPDFKEEICTRLLRPPYVCNACSTRRHCALTKTLYYADKAQKAYANRLKESRSGISYTADELRYLDELLRPLVKRKQSLHSICVTQKDKLICCERTLYQLIDQGLFSIRNLDLPRKVRYRPRQKAKAHKVDRLCRENRTFLDFHAFLQRYPGLTETQIDSVVGRIGGKVLLTIFWPQAQFMLLLLRDQNTSQSVIDCLNLLNNRLGVDRFRRLFPVLLGDNGSEFSNPTAIEHTIDGLWRTRLFYCDPQKPEHKPGIERNHEFIRQVLPSGTSFDHLTQSDMDLLASHMNSYLRPSLNDKTPCKVFSYLFGPDFLEALSVRLIPAADVNLSPSLLPTPPAAHNCEVDCHG